MDDDAAESGLTQLLELVADLVPKLWDAPDAESAAGLLLEAARLALGAEWGVLLRLEGEEPVRVSTCGVRPGREAAPLSRTVLDALDDAAEPILVAPTRGDIRSLHMDVRSVLACPMDLGEGARGGLFLESRATRKTFREGERPLLGALARIGGELLSRAASTRTLDRQRTRLQALERAGRGAPLGEARLVGASSAMDAVREGCRRVAASGVTALLRGESGTGKEVAARVIHDLGPRADAPFVAVNCGALPRDLLESELFGHARGAFSGAEQDRLGRFEMADGGTLFLDELGELPPEAQVKLLRVLEERVVQRLGEGRERSVDVHLLAATNVDLDAAVASGAFRQDLFYRVSVFQVELPPLRERAEDIPALVGVLLPRLAQRLHRPARSVAPSAMAALQTHAWPGNVRELRNVLEQAAVRADGEELGPEHLSLPAGAGSPPPRATPPGAPPATLPTGTLDQARDAWERDFLLAALRTEDGNVSTLLERLGISKSAFYRRVRRLGIDLEALRDEEP